MKRKPMSKHINWLRVFVYAFTGGIMVLLWIEGYYARAQVQRMKHEAVQRGYAEQKTNQPWRWLDKPRHMTPGGWK